MSVSSQISRRYASALVSSMGDASDDAFKTVADELGRFAQALAEVPAARQVLFNPAFSVEEKLNAMKAIADKLSVSENLQRFLGLMLERDRGSEIEAVAGQVRQFVDDRSKRIRGKVESAGELTPDTLENLKKALEKRTGKKVELDVEVDPSLLGGLRATVGSTVFDGTLRTQLDQIKETLRRA